MNESLNPAATQHVPFYITAPGGTDVLMVVLSVILLLSVLLFGSLFFRLHTMPERMAHRGHKIQFEIVAVLGLLALFTHIHLFWVAGLLLALIDIPDFAGSLSRIAGSPRSRRIWAGRGRRGRAGGCRAGCGAGNTRRLRKYADIPTARSGRHRS
jgi:hypothetical protein